MKAAPQFLLLVSAAVMFPASAVMVETTNEMLTRIVFFSALYFIVLVSIKLAPLVGWMPLSTEDEQIFWVRFRAVFSSVFSAERLRPLAVVRH